jgi:hypothetical protein
MNGRQRKLTAKKNTIIKKNNQKKIHFENFEIGKGISLKIINVKVEKAKIDIHGNYIFKIDNESHYEVGVELDFTGSSQIFTRDMHNSENGLIFKQQIDSFSHQSISNNNNSNNNFSATNHNNSSTNIHHSVSEDQIDINAGKICEMEYLIGYHVNSKIKFEINFPTLEKQKNLIQTDVDLLSNQLELCERHLKYIAYEVLPFTEFSNLLKNFNIKQFVDWEFSPKIFSEIEISIDEYISQSNSLSNITENTSTSLFNMSKTIAVHWRPIENLLPENKKVLYTTEDITPLDIIYGIKSNSSVISVLTHIAEFPSLINRILIDRNINKCGLYKVRLYNRGSWKEFHVDNLIPCFTKSFPIYTYSLNSGWVMFVEKALAKLFGGYEKLSELSIEKIYKALTGLPVVCHSLKYINKEKEKLSWSNSEVENITLNNMNIISNFSENEINLFFEKLEDASLQGYIMTAYADKDYIMNKKNFQNSQNLENSPNENYFVKDFAYPIIAAINTGQYKMIILRNMWKDINFQGEFYLNSNKLPANVLRYFETYQEKTVIIMTPREFTEYFNNICIIYSKNFFELSLRSKFVRCQDTVETDLESIISHNYYEVTVDLTTQLKICLSLNEDEFFQDKFFSENMDMSIGILSKDNIQGKWIKIYHQDFVIEKQILVEVTLMPGKYVIIPRTMGYCMRKNKYAYSCNFSPFIQDGKSLNLEILSKIFEEIFYLNDADGNGELSFNELEKIINRLNGQLDEDEYKNIVKKYCQYSDCLTLNGFIYFMRDIFVLKKENQIFEFLRNLGYDKNLYPYLQRFYSIHFYSLKNIKIQSKFNIYENFDKIFCNLILEEISVQDRIRNSEFTSISYKSQ